MTAGRKAILGTVLAAVLAGVPAALVQSAPAPVRQPAAQSTPRPPAAVGEQGGVFKPGATTALDGDRRAFSMPLDLRGTPFQLACWHALLAIPYGETRTYADIARAIGHPNAFRAVGMANNRNPIAIVVPCHRVIATGGSLCGYGGGLGLKRKLLDLEQAHMHPCLPLGIGA